MGKANQSISKRLERLNDGRCPIHGSGMSQVGNSVTEGKHFFVVKCPRKLCDITGLTVGSLEPVTLVDRYEYLILNNKLEKK